MTALFVNQRLDDSRRAFPASPTDGMILKPRRLCIVSRVYVAKIDKDRRAQQRLHALEVERPEDVPLRDDHQHVAPCIAS